MRGYYFSVTRRAFIEAKYVQKLFLRSLPARSVARTIKRWTVTKAQETDEETNKTPTRHVVAKLFEFRYKTIRI